MTRTATLYPAIVAPRKLLLFGLLSILLHVAVLVGLVAAPDFSSGYEDLGPVYTVDLVGDLGPPPAPEETGPETTAPEPANTPPPEPAGVQEPVKAEPAAPAPKPAELIPVGKPEEPVKPPPETLSKIGAPKRSSKRLIIDSDKELAEALAATRARLDAKRQAEAKADKKAADEERHLAQAMSRMRQTVAGRVYGSGGGSPNGGKSNNALARYYTLVWQRIRSNWTLPEEWRNGGMAAVVVIRIRRDGTIIEHEFEKKSGNARFDQSVAWAVERSDPLPPLPQSVTSSTLEIGVKFIPEG